MNQATILFPGQKLSYHVLDYALDWARDNEAVLQVIFFLPEFLSEESYPFPNDLDQAEILKRSFDAEQGLDQILQQEMRFVEKRANSRHVQITFVTLYSPTIETIIETTGASDILFIDRSLEEKEEIFEDLSFDMEKLLDRIPRMLLVGEYDRYSDVVY